jgi:hypothetical protein
MSLAMQTDDIMDEVVRAAMQIRRVAVDSLHSSVASNRSAHFDG